MGTRPPHKERDQVKHKTSRFPFVIVREYDGGRTIHHEDQFFDDLTRDPEGKRNPWVSKERRG